MSECTINGWYWYCDLHDTHGNADSQDEAEHVSAAHEDFLSDVEGCDIVVVKVTEFD